MRLSRIFVDQALDGGAQIRLEAGTCNYLRNVLRLRPGASISLFNGQDGYDYESELSFEGKQILARVGNRKPGECESALPTKIIQGLSRSDHMDWTIQKCTELGATSISVFNAQHTQISLKPTQLDKRLRHWRNIAIKACEQCGRQIPPSIDFQNELTLQLRQARHYDMKILLHFDGGRLTSEPVSPGTPPRIAILVGPEGGLSETELGSARDAGFISTRLGPRVLRTETAAAATLAILQYNYGDI